MKIAKESREDHYWEVMNNTGKIQGCKRVRHTTSSDIILDDGVINYEPYGPYARVAAYGGKIEGGEYTSWGYIVRCTRCSFAEG